MAKATKKSGSGRTNQIFSKGVKVLIADIAHELHGESGITQSDKPDIEGFYSLEVVHPDSGKTEQTRVHADKLELHPDEHAPKDGHITHVEVNSGFPDTDGTERNYTIKEATLKEDVCNYGYELTEGGNTGDIHNVKPSGIIDDDLRHAFGGLNVHMAALDSAFSLAGVKADSIDELRGHELAFRYNVTSLKVIGHDESVTLTGNKFSPACGARIEIKVPKIPLDNLSSYQFAPALKLAVDVVREEVALYKEGKYTEAERDDKGSRQLTIADAMDDDGSDDEDLESGRV
jgi:hypothetical protein